MRKYLIGFLAGILVATAGVAAADTVSLIGKKVQSEASVTLDGNKIDTAIIVDGKSYAPVRSVAEATGLKVGYEKGNVKLESNADSLKRLQVLKLRLESLKIDLQSAENRAASKEQSLESSLESRAKWQKILDNLADDASEETRNRYEQLIDGNVEGHAILQAELAELQAKVTETKKKISEVEDEIAELQG